MARTSRARLGPTFAEQRVAESRRAAAVLRHMIDRASRMEREALSLAIDVLEARAIDAEGVDE